MKILVLFVVLATVAFAAEEPQRFYHETVGVPEATRIRQAEQARDFDGSRIVGGSAAGLGAHPHIVSISVRRRLPVVLSLSYSKV